MRRGVQAEGISRAPNPRDSEPGQGVVGKDCDHYYAGHRTHEVPPLHGSGDRRSQIGVVAAPQDAAAQGQFLIETHTGTVLTRPGNPPIQGRPVDIPETIHNLARANAGDG